MNLSDSKLLDGIYENDFKKVAEAIADGANVNVRTNSFHQTPIIIATYMHNEDMVKYLLEFKADGSIPDGCGDNALHWVASGTAFNSESIAKILIDSGVDVNQKNFLGCTPLMHTVISTNVNVAKLLIEHGARLDITNIKNETVLDKAFRLGKPNFGEMLKSLEIECKLLSLKEITH